MAQINTEEIILLNNVFRDEAVAAFLDGYRNNNGRRKAEAYALLLESDREGEFADYLARRILFDDNLFARRAFEGTLTPHIAEAYRHDLSILQRVAKLAAPSEQDGGLSVCYGKGDPLFGKDWDSDQTLAQIE